VKATYSPDIIKGILDPLHYTLALAVLEAQQKCFLEMEKQLASERAPFWYSQSKWDKVQSEKLQKYKDRIQKYGAISSAAMAGIWTYAYAHENEPKLHRLSVTCDHITKLAKLIAQNQRSEYVTLSEEDLNQIRLARSY